MAPAGPQLAVRQAFFYGFGVRTSFQQLHELKLVALAGENSLLRIFHAPADDRWRLQTPVAAVAPLLRFECLPLKCRMFRGDPKTPRHSAPCVRRDLAGLHPKGTKDTKGSDVVKVMCSLGIGVVDQMYTRGKGGLQRRDPTAATLMRLCVGSVCGEQSISKLPLEFQIFLCRSPVSTQSRRAIERLFSQVWLVISRIYDVALEGDTRQFLAPIEACCAEPA